jgi:hypothetical protein
MAQVPGRPCITSCQRSRLFDLWSNPCIGANKIADREFRLCCKRFGRVATVPRSIAAPQQRWRDFRMAQ